MDALLPRHDLCPRGTADLTNCLRKHFVECTWIRVQVREVHARAQATREQAREAGKLSGQRREQADRLAAEADAELERSRSVKRGPFPGF
jgi:hypothetical protein